MLHIPKAVCITAGAAWLVLSAPLSSPRAAVDTLPKPASFRTRCAAPGVALCLALDSESEIARLRTVPKQLDARTRIQFDAGLRAAQFTVPSKSAADSSGSLMIKFPRGLTDVYVAFDVYYPADFLQYRFKSGGGWKMFILGQGGEGCAPYEIVGGNLYYNGYPRFYYLCGIFAGVEVQNPYGDNSSEFDYQPGGDTQCLRHGRKGSPPCAVFVADQWVTYQVHVNTIAKHLEVWQTVAGKTLQIIDFHLAQLPDSFPSYEWLMLTPYNTGKDAAEQHPVFRLWHRRVIVSTKKIAPPVVE